MKENNIIQEPLFFHNVSDLLQQNHKAVFAIIPKQIEHLSKSLHSPVNALNSNNINNSPKILPDYNFQSLFRKKSHLRLARNKNKEEALKNSARNGNCKNQNFEKQTKHLKKGHWTFEENRTYHWFLELHSRHFILKHLRRTDKIFKSMASFIGTRQAEQCRSHHQKMEKKYHNFYQIILKLRGQFYTSNSVDLVKADLEQNGYAVIESQLISELELKNGEERTRHLGPEATNDDNSDSQNPKLSNRDEYLKLYGSDCGQSNIMGENYEDKLDFKIQYKA